MNQISEWEEDAWQMMEVLDRRFVRFGLRLHPNKTRLVDFGNPPRIADNHPPSGRGFDLLEFIHFWGVRE